jgi:hypothetical protein
MVDAKPTEPGITFKVMHGETECLTVLCHSRIAKRMIGFGLIDKDLKSCLGCVHLHRSLGMKDPRDRLIKWATFIALCITYGKCFVSAESRRIRLEPTLVPTEYVAAHNKLMTLRHDYAAHAGGIEERGLAPIGLNPDLNDKRVLEVGPSISLHIGQISDHDLGIYELLISALISKVAVKVEEARLALKAEVERMNIDDLYAAVEPRQGAA